MAMDLYKAGIISLEEAMRRVGIESEEDMLKEIEGNEPAEPEPPTPPEPEPEVVP